MLKLLVMLGTFLLVALTLLGLRHQRLELTNESTRIYSQIQDRNETLLDQRVEIAQQTNPWALANVLQQSGVNTGAALQPRANRAGRAVITTPQVETDLVAPLIQGRGP